MSPKFVWRKAVGSRGSRVSAIERTPGRFYLRYWVRGEDGAPGKWRLEAIDAASRTDAEAQALAMSRALLLAEQRPAGHAITVGALLARYADEVSAHKKGQQPKEDARRAALWLAVLGASREARTVSKESLKKFERARRKGTIQAKQWRTIKGVRQLVPVKLTPNPSETTIGADIIYLQAVWNWAVAEELLPTSRIAKYAERPKTKNPKQPRASMERYAALRTHADTAHPRFGAFLDLVMWLGWRVSGVCAVRACDVDRTKSEFHPHGRIWKNPAADKEGVAQWVPMPAAVRTAVDTIGAIGDAPLFPRRKRPTMAWSRWYARDLLEKVEKAAGIAPVDGGDFHPYRRLWATLRKHFPVQDVMAAGGWRDPRSLQTAYQQSDEATLRDVALHDPTPPAPEKEKPADGAAG